MAKQQLHLYSTKTCSHVGPVQTRGLDVIFPQGVDGWTDVLDCREEPYTERTLAENCDYAIHVRKKYILVGESQIAQETPPTEAD